MTQIIPYSVLTSTGRMPGHRLIYRPGRLGISPRIRSFALPAPKASRVNPVNVPYKFPALRIIITKLTFVFVNALESAIRKRALILLRSAQSIRFGGWPQALDRYPHENIHETRPDRASAGHAQIACPFRGRGAARPGSPGRCSRAGPKVPGKPAGVSALFPNQPGIRP
jgi:hypothetical protein